MKKLSKKELILLAATISMSVSVRAAEIEFSEPVLVTDTSVLDVELDNADYTYIEGVTYGSGEKTIVTVGGNTITLAGDSGTGLGSVDMPAETPNATSGYYNAGTQWNTSLLPTDTDVQEWTDALRGNLWHNNASDDARPLTLHLAGLTIGKAYSVQLYSTDARSTNREQAYWGSFSEGIFSGGSSASISQNPAYKVTGTFVADAAYQDIFLQETDGIDNDDTTLAVYTLYGTPFPSVMNPVPSKGTTNVSLTPTLEWTLTNAEATHFDLYFGPYDDPNLSTDPAYLRLTMEPVSTTSFSPGTLEYNTEYYWRIDVHESESIKIGSVWKFTTVGQAPVVSLVEPATTAVDAGSDAVIAVTGSNVETYQWFMVGDASPLSDGDKYSGVATDTLTINNVQLADEGQYYCQVSNSVYPELVDSDLSLVMTRRMIIHYPLDIISTQGENTITPDVVGGYDMTLVSADTGTDLPSLVSGVSELGGSGLLFDNEDSTDPNSNWRQYATAGDVDMEIMGDGLTISFWVQWLANNTNWQGIINRRGSWDATDMMWRIDKNPDTGAISFGRRDNANEGHTSIDLGQWNYIVVAVDYDSTVLKTYKDGELVDADSGFTFGFGSDSEFKLGCNNDNGTEFFSGIIDDVKIYNYALNTEQVANEYLAVKGGWVCNNEGVEDLTFDVNSDCQFDLVDFAEIAATWMNSNRIYAQ